MPEIIPYSAWGKPSDDKVQNLRDYADYVREEHFKEGSLLDYEQDIQNGIKQRAIKDGLIDPGAPEDDENNAEVFGRLFDTQQDSQDVDLGYLKDQYIAEKDDTRAAAIRNYLAHKKVGNEEGLARSLEEITPFATKENVREARRAAADRGDVSFIAIEDEDDNGETFRYIYTAPDTEAPTAEELPFLLSKLKNEGAIQTSDLLRLEFELGSDPGQTVPRFKAQRGRDFLNQMPSVLANNKELNTLIGKIAQVESNTRSFENSSDAWQVIKGTGIGLMGGLAATMTALASTVKTGIKGARGEGFKWGENTAKDLEMLSGTSGLWAHERSIVEKLAASPLGEQFSEDEIKTYLGDMIKLNMAPKFDDDEPSRNFLRLSNGTMHAHEALLANPALHDEQVDSLEIDSSQKDALKSHRRMRLAATAPDQRKRIIKVFGSKAVDQLNEIKAAGGSDSDFVEAFLSDGDNFSKFKNSWGLIGSSTFWALPEGLAGLAQMGFQISEELGKTVDHYGEAWGSETLEVIGEETKSMSQSGVRAMSSAIYGIQNFKGKYRERAELFGSGIGIATEIATVIPQVAVDLLATKGIMTASKGVGRAIGVAASKTAQATKLNRLASTALAGKLSAKSKAWLGGNSGSVKFSKGVGKFADDMIKQTIPLSIPAYSRSYSATYASLYNQLPDEMSHEEKHSHANGFAALSGLNTAAIMFGFAKVGAAGVEKLVMKGFSWKQMKLLYDDALNAGKVSSDASFASAVENSYKAAHRHFWVKALKHPLGEAAEESLDELGQGLIEAAALNEDVSLHELSQQVWHSGLIGGPLGLAGTAKVMGFRSTLKGTSIIEQVKAQNDFYSGIAARLTTAESPQTATTIRRLIEQNNRRAEAEEEIDLPTPNRVDPGEVEPDGQIRFDLGDVRGTRTGAPLVRVDQRGQELPLGDPRRAPEGDPSQLTFDFDGPPPNIDPATGEPSTQPLLLGEADDPAQARFDFRDPAEVEAAEEATPGEEPFRTRTPESEATDPLLPDFELDGEQAELDFEGADVTTPAPARSPEPETIRELVGRRAQYGEYRGVVQIDPVSGEAVLVLHEPTESGATEVVLGSPNNPPTGIKTQNRLGTLTKDTGGFPAGTPFVRVGKSRYALPDEPNIEAILDADGNPVGIVIKGAQRIEGGRLSGQLLGQADVEIRVKEKALEVLRYYGIDFGGLAPSEDGDPSIVEIQETLNLNPDADAETQIDELTPGSVSSHVDRVLEILEGGMTAEGIDPEGQLYADILDAIDLILSGNIKNKDYVAALADIPMEVMDAVRSRLEKAFDVITESAPSPERDSVAQTLIKIISKYESRERVYLNEHQRRINAESDRAADAGAAPDAGAAGTPAADTGAKPDDKPSKVKLEDPLSSPLSSAAKEGADPQLELELEIENAPKTETVVVERGEAPKNLEQIEQLELTLTGIANDPNRKTEERQAATEKNTKVKKAKRKAQTKVNRKQSRAAAELRERKRKNVPTPPSDEETRKKKTTQSKVDQIKNRGEKKKETKSKSVKITKEVAERIIGNFSDHGELSEVFNNNLLENKEDAGLEAIVVGLVSEATKVPESAVRAVLKKFKAKVSKKGALNINEFVTNKTYTGEPATTKANGEDVIEIERQRSKKEETEAAALAEKEQEETGEAEGDARYLVIVNVRGIKEDGEYEDYAERWSIGSYATEAEAEAALAEADGEVEGDLINSNLQKEVLIDGKWQEEPVEAPDVEGSGPVAITARLAEKADAAAVKAMEKIRKEMGGGKTMLGLDPTILGQVAIVGSKYIARGVADFTKWSAEMIAAFKGIFTQKELDPKTLRKIFNKSGAIHAESLRAEEEADTGEAAKKKTAKKKAAKKAAAKKAAKKRGRPKKVKLSSAELKTAKLTRKKGKDFAYDGTWEYQFEGDSRVFTVYHDKTTNYWKATNATQEERNNYQDILGANVNDLEVTLRAKAVVAAEQEAEIPGDKYKDDEFRNEAEKVSFLEAVKSGFLVRDLANILPGFRKTGKQANTYNKRKADYLENQVFELYPKTESFLSKKEEKDLQEGYAKKVDGKAYRKAGTTKKTNIPIPVKRDVHGEVLVAYFTNDPREAVDAIEHGISIFIPKKFIKLHNDPKSKFRINNSIKFNEKSGEIESVQLNPAEPPVVPGFRKRAKSDFRLRIFERANAFGRQLFDITPKGHPVQHATLQKLLADMYPPTEVDGVPQIGELEKAFSILFRETTGVTLNHDFVTLLYNVTYVETSLRLKEVEIAKEIKAAVSRVDARRGEGEPPASVEDLGVDVIPNIIRRKFLKDKSNEGEFLDVLSGYLDVPKGASPESMMNVYGKNLLEDLKSGGRFPHGLVPSPFDVARVMGSNLPAAQRRRETPEISMEEEGVAEQVAGTTTEGLSERVALENEYDLAARSILIHDRLVELLDADPDASPTGIRFHFNTIAIKAGFLNATELKPSVLIGQIKNYLLTADQATPEGRVARAFELALSETEAGREAMLLLIEAGVIPVDSTRAEAISEIIREDSSFDSIDELLFRLNRLENEQGYYDAKASSDSEITEAALGENRKEATELGLVSGDASSVVDALIQIKRTSDNPVHREVADLLLLNPELITNVEFRIIEASTAEFAGRFFPEENMVILNLARSNGRGLADALMHEYLHASTISALTNPQNARQRAAIQRMDNLRKLAADQARKQGLLDDPDFMEMYGDAFNSNVEFLTYMLTDTRFQSVLQSVSVPGQKSFLRKLADTVIRALGFNPNDNKMSAKEQAITELLDFTRMVSEPGLFGVSEKTARIEQRKRGLSALERLPTPTDFVESGVTEEAVNFSVDVNTAQQAVDQAMLEGAVEVASGILGSKPHELAKLMHSKNDPKDNIIWDKNWRGLAKNWKSKRAERAFYSDVDQMGTRLHGVLERALYEYPEFVSWYAERVQMALDIFGELDADIKNPEDNFVFKAILAVTSNGNKVKDQTIDSWKIYQKWKETGKFYNEDVKPRGTRTEAIQNHFKLLDKWVDQHGWEFVEAFLSTTGTVTKLRSRLQNDFGYSKEQARDLTKGELPDEVVPFSLVFGAKLGSFHYNLNGNFDTITMDLWFMRTFGRTAGAQLRKETRQQFNEKKARVDKAITAYLKADPKGELFKEAGLGRKRKRSTEVVVMLAKFWTNAGNRQTYWDNEANLDADGNPQGGWVIFSGKMEKADPVTNELRRAINALFKVVDNGVELIEAPGSGGHRRFIRLAMLDAIAKLEQQTGVRMNPAEAQAILWYYEKAVHEEFGSKAEAGEAPDYGTAANEVFRNNRGSDAISFRESTANRRRGRLSGDSEADSGVVSPVPTSRIPEAPPTFFPGEADALSNPEIQGASIGYDESVDPYEAVIDVVEYAQEITPAGFEVVEVADGPAAFTMKKYPGVIFVNPSRLAAAVEGMSEQNAQNMVESIISEELAHLAGLQAIPSKQEIEMLETTSEAQLLRWLENYAQGVSEEKRQAFIEERMRLIREAGDDLTPKLNILREHLRATLQRATRGTTTEEDVAFYRNNPGHWAVVFRYLKKAFTVLKTRIGLKFNPRLAAMIDQMRREVVRMNNGGRLRDKVSRIVDGNYDINFADLNSMLAASVGSTVNFEDTLEIFDLPIALAQGTGDYDDGGRISRLFRKSGDIDPRLKEVDEVRSQMVRMIGQRMDSRAKTFRKLLNKLYGGAENAPSDIIATAFGSNEPLLTQADFDAAEQKFDVDYALIEHDQTVELAKADLLRASGDPKAAYTLEKKWFADKAARIKTANANKEADLNQRAIKNALSHKAASKSALASLPNELAAEISAMRAEIDTFSTKVQELDGNMTARMKGVFDRNKGIYITRSYKLFIEPGFAEQMASDPSYKKVRDDAAKFFRPILIKQWTEHYLKADTTGTLTKADATIMAENHVNNNNLDQKAVEEFLARYDGDAGGHAKNSSSFKLDMNRFMLKGNVPAELRALMGEETDPFKNAFRTYANVGLLASNMNFLNEFTRAGVDGGFIVDRATVNSDPVKYKDYRVIKPSSQKAFHPLNGMYAPKALIDTMEAMFSASQVLEQESSAKAMTKITEVFARATGLALGMKTLGSIGFFIRNFLSNLMFFGPMQGYFLNPAKIKQHALLALDQWKGNTDDYLSHLISLGVVGDDVRSNVLNDMIRGKAEDPAAMQQNLHSFSDSLFDKVGALQSLNNKTAGKAYKFLQGASVAIDAFHKIGLYEYELSVLKKAYPSKPRTEIEQLAADKVKMTAQSYSQAPPLIRNFTRSGLGLVIAPFARFKGEVFRVGINTIRLGMSEISSGNSVLRKRGLQRLGGFAAVIGGLSTALPYILQAIMAGMSDEEEEAYRAGLPEYAKNNTYYFIKPSLIVPGWSDKIWAVDLTYTNPFALVMDPLLRSMDAIRTGRTDEIAEIGGRALFQQFFSEQIAFKAATSWAKNYDEQSGRPIYNDAAPFHEKFGQGFLFALKKAYAPRTFEKLWDARNLAKMPDLTDEEGNALAGNAAAVNLLLMEFVPSKPRVVDPDKLAGRYLRTTFRQYSELRSELGKLKTSRPMSGEKVAKIYANNVKDRVRMMNKLRRISRGYESMGVDMSVFAQKMVSSGFSKSRTRAILYRGVLDRPVPAKETIQTILRVAPEGRDRMKQYYDAVRAVDRYIELE